MGFTKSLVWIGIVAQAACALAYADAAPAVIAAATSSPEAKLITSMVALSGQDLKSDEMQERISAALTQYEAAAPLDGRAERTEEALVALKLESPAQAHAFEEQVQAAVQDLSTKNLGNPADAQKAFETEMMGLIASSGGAEFSRCGNAKLMTAAVAAAGFAIAVNGTGWGSGIGLIVGIGASMEFMFEITAYDGNLGGCTVPDLF